MAEDIVARLEVTGDGDAPPVAILDEPVSRPDVAVEAALRNLEELQGCLADARARAAAPREVVDDGTLVGLGPRVPLEGEGRSRGHGDGRGTRAAVAVADDVRGAGGVGLDEAEVRVGGSPAGARWVVGVVGVGGRVEVVVGLAADGDGLDEAVGGDGGCASEEGEESHFGGRIVGSNLLDNAELKREEGASDSFLV